MPFCPNKTMWIVLCKNFQVRKIKARETVIYPRHLSSKIKDANTAVEGLEPGAASPLWAAGNRATSAVAGLQVSFRNTAQTKGLQGTREHPPKQGSILRPLLLMRQLLQSGNHRHPAVFLETLSVYAFNSLPISDEQYTLQPPVSNNNHEKFTCPKWERSREISIKHCMWSLVWEVTFNSWDTEELMASFRYYSNKFIKKHLFFQLVLMYYAN